MVDEGVTVKPGDMIYVDKFPGEEFLLDSVKGDSTEKTVGSFVHGQCGIILGVKKTIYTLEKRDSIQGLTRRVFTNFLVLTSGNEIGWVCNYNVKRIP